MEIDESYWGNNRINCGINSIETIKESSQTRLKRINCTNNKFLISKTSNTRMSNTMFAKVIPTLMLILNIVTYYMANASLMSLPDGIENILGFVPKSTFKCERDGYFGDIDNDCKIFHLCQKQINPSGKTEWRHWTYACGNQTMFNQLTLTCAFVDEAIPCRHASQFQYLNEVIHKPKEPFLTDADVTSGISYYSNRVMSDGARTRAFRDSRLMAQLGGEAMLNSLGSSNTMNNFQPQQSQQIQRQPQPQPQQQPSFFFQPLPNHKSFNNNNNNNNNRRETSIDNEDTSNRADNAIDTPDQTSSFQPVFNQQVRPQQQQTQPQFSNEFTVNHQHQTNENLRPAFTKPNQFTPESQSSSIWGDSNGSRFFSALPQQQSKPLQPRSQTSLLPTSGSFDFSISTNHQLGPASDAPIITSNQFRPLQVEPQFTTAAVPSQFSSEPTSTENQANQPTSSPFNVAPTFSRLPTTTLSNNQQFLPTTTTTTTKPTTTNSQPLSTEPQFQTTTQGSLLAPTTSTTPATTTSATTTNLPVTTTATPIPTATASTATTMSIERQRQQQQPRRRQTGESRSLRSQSGRQQQRNNNQNNLLFDQIHRPFQSTRLSAQRRQEPALVLRRQANQAASQAASQPLVETSNLASPSLRAFSPVIEESNSFWLSPFDAQFMAPRFESLLTRRRV